MSEYRVASRYAKSLLDLSKEQNSVEAIKADIDAFSQLLKSSAALQNLLKSPVVNIGDKIAVLHKLFDRSFNKTTLTFFDIVVRKGRSNVLDAIAECFVEQYNELNQIVAASVKTAHPIDEKTAAEIMQFVQKQGGKKVSLTTTIDKDLIGGVVIQVGDNLYDASIAGKLNKVKQNLLNTYISK